MKRILGLDLGTNSIGWAFVEQGFEKKIPRSTQDLRIFFGL